MTPTTLISLHGPSKQIGGRVYALDTAPRLSGKRAVRHAAESALYRAGFANLFARVTRQSGAIILNYHSIADRDAWRWIDPANSLPLDLFEEQMAFLARHRSVISMSALLDELEAGRTPMRGTVVLTFDDGYLDVLTYAAPILARYSMPAIMYVPTGCIDRDECAWVDTVYHAFTARTRHEYALPELGIPLTTLTGDGISDRVAYRAICKRMVEAALVPRERSLDAIQEQLQPVGRPPRLTMTWSDLRTLRRQFPLFDIGTHTVDHLDLTKCSEAEVARQSAQSADDTERELGQRARHFACPYDRCTPAIRNAVLAAGYRSVVSAGAQVLVKASGDPRWLCRVGAPRSITSLGYVTSGAYPGMSQLLFRRS